MTEGNGGPKVLHITSSVLTCVGVVNKLMASLCLYVNYGSLARIDGVL